MVDISMEILASSVASRNGYRLRHRVKTWWAHIDVPPDITAIKLPRLPMIQQYLIMTGKDTTMFVETWEEEKGVDSKNVENWSKQRRFVGITTCTVDEQLKNHILNPSVQWLEVHDPIEDIVKGKLLLKIDAKFAFPNDSSIANSESVLEVNTEQSPVKIVHSPRHSLVHNLDSREDYSPEKHSTISSQFSRKSDQSVFSIASSRSQEQGIQTDLSLAVLPDISKYTRALNSQQVMDSRSEEHVPTQDKRKPRASSMSTAAPSSSAIINPIQHAQDILLKEQMLLVNSKSRRASEPVTGKPPIPTSSNAGRRNLLVRQNQQQQQYSSKREEVGGGEPNPSNFENIEDVIDTLNDGFIAPTKRKEEKARHPTHDKEHLHRGRSSNGNAETNSNLRREESDKMRPISNNDEAGTRSRFKEVHYDGALAKEQATNILIAHKTSNNNSQTKTNPKPSPVIRRRIAAAIFND